MKNPIKPIILLCTLMFSLPSLFLLLIIIFYFKIVEIYSHELRKCNWLEIT